MADDSKKPPSSSSDTPPLASSNADAQPSSSHTSPPALSNSNAPSPASNSSFTMADDSKKPPTSSSSGTPQPASHIDLSSSVPPAPSKSLLKRSRSTTRLPSESLASDSAAPLQRAAASVSSINAAATTSSSKPDSPRSADIHKQEEIQLASDSSSRRSQEIQEVSSSSRQIDSAPRKSPLRAPYSRPSIRYQQSSPTPQQQQQQQQQERQEEELEAPNSNCCYITCMIISIGAFGWLLSFIVRSSSSLLFNSIISLSIAPRNNQLIHLNIFNYCFRSTFLGKEKSSPLVRVLHYALNFLADKLGHSGFVFDK
ncbi:hypothetical protein QL285_005674 [Trifolium repens]|nr:hypothetical protein QL285_005674 [Trifolium repens]